MQRKRKKFPSEKNFLTEFFVEMCFRGKLRGSGFEHCSKPELFKRKNVGKLKENVLFDNK